MIIINKSKNNKKDIMEELNKSESLFKIIFENAPDGYFLSDLKGNFVYGNKTAEDIIGYKKSELMGKNMLKIGILSKKQAVRAAKRLAQHALVNSSDPGEFELNKKDGVKVSVEITGNVVRIMGKTLVLGIVRDISKRKRMEEKLKIRNEDLEKFKKLAVGRELKMIELKKEIEKLKKKLKI